MSLGAGCQEQPPNHRKLRWSLTGSCCDRVRISGAGRRRSCCEHVRGRGPTKLGVIPLSDGAGEVASIGAGVTRVKIGDRVAGCFHPRWFGGRISADYLTDRLGANLDGMLAEYAVLSEEALVHVPSHLSFEKAASLPCAAVTAWVALTGRRRVIAGDTVLTQGSGGVSLFALQFARLLGARVIATTSSSKKAERLKVHGFRARLVIPASTRVQAAVPQRFERASYRRQSLVDCLRHRREAPRPTLQTEQLQDRTICTPQRSPGARPGPWLSNGIELGPRIGIQSEPLSGVGTGLSR